MAEKRQLPGPDDVRLRREARTLLAATLTRGPGELIDFLLPLWAGASVGLRATDVGLLIAMELAVSVIARPLAGVVADAVDRRHVAASGAGLYAASCAGYAVAGGPGVAYVAAAIGGVGGALLWVAVRAIISERLADDSGVFPRLLAAEENGSWIAFAAGLSLIGWIGYGGVFLACAGACAVAAVALELAPARPVSAVASRPGRSAVGRAAAGLGTVGRRLRPMLLAVGLTMLAEATVSLLLILHLQRGFRLDVTEVALVFLPGAIAMSLAAEHLHRYVLRFGRSRILALAAISSATFAAALAWAPTPHVVAVLWILSGLSWAAVIPIQQAVVAEASGEQAGQGMGVYESASLIGALAGSLVAGALYDSANWHTACYAAAATLLAGAFITPWAVRRLGVLEFPPPPPAVSAPAASPTPAATGTCPMSPDAVSSGVDDEGDEPPAAGPRKSFIDLAGHAGLYAASQVVAAFFDFSWVTHAFADEFLEVINGTNRDYDGLLGLLYSGQRIWAFILLVDILWTSTKVLTRLPARSKRP